MSRLNVLNAFHTWLPNTQTWMHAQVQKLLELGIDTHVACERTRNLEQFHVANIHALANESRSNEIWHRILRTMNIRTRHNHLLRTGQRIGATVIHSHFGNTGWYNQPAVNKLGIPHVVTFYGWDVNLLPQQFLWPERYRALFREADLFLCEGKHMAKCIIALGCPAEKVKVQHLGVDIDRFAFRPRKYSPSEPLRIMIAASFREKKGIPDAIRAVGLLNRDIPLQLTIIGDAGQDTQSRREKSLIISDLEKEGLMQNTRLLGYQPHQVMLDEAYRQHIFLSPSLTAQDGDTEGGAPVSLIEMAATGMPIVSTRHCDIPEVILDGVTGLLADERDVHELHRHLRWWASHPEAWEDMLTSGRQHIEREYALTQQVAKLVTHYKSLC